MTKADFIQAKEFIFRDLEREATLAKACSSGLRALGIASGGGNFLAALGLLCYTEFVGKIHLTVKRSRGKYSAAESFNHCFDLMGSDYQRFRASHDVYGTFRCGLAHEYYVKKICDIAMLEATRGPGLMLDQAGRYKLVVENYCRDLKVVFGKIQRDVYESNSREVSARPMMGTNFLQSYYLERHLFGAVSQRYAQKRPLAASDFLCIVTWQANRGKSEVAETIQEEDLGTKAGADPVRDWLGSLIDGRRLDRQPMGASHCRWTVDASASRLCSLCANRSGRPHGTGVRSFRVIAEC